MSAQHETVHDDNELTVHRFTGTSWYSTLNLVADWLTTSGLDHAPARIELSTNHTAYVEVPRSD